ncbi:MAG: DNA-3-methyladenine glycosylase I [Pseudomonadales bacterium]
MALENSSRCEWCLGDPLYEAYHDLEWGVPLRDERKLFEFLILEGAQAGLSWITVLKKRENYRAAFYDFDPEKVARFDEADVAALLGNPGIIRNRLKVRSAINNAQQFLKVAESGSFADLVWQFVDGVPRQNRFRTRNEVPASTVESDAMAKSLKKLGFNFVGTTICYAFMQATGMVNDHMVTCPGYQRCQELA